MFLIFQSKSLTAHPAKFILDQLKNNGNKKKQTENQLLMRSFFLFQCMKLISFKTMYFTKPSLVTHTPHIKIKQKLKHIQKLLKTLEFSLDIDNSR